MKRKWLTKIYLCWFQIKKNLWSPWFQRCKGYSMPVVVTLELIPAGVLVKDNAWNHHCTTDWMSIHRRPLPPRIQPMWSRNPTRASSCCQRRDDNLPVEIWEVLCHAAWLDLTITMGCSGSPASPCHITNIRPPSVLKLPTNYRVVTQSQQTNRHLWPP